MSDRERGRYRDFGAFLAGFIAGSMFGLILLIIFVSIGFLQIGV